MNMKDILPTVHQLSNCVAACLIALTLTVTADGHGGGGDIAVFETDGKVDVGFAVLDDQDIEQVSFDPNQRVFQAVLTTVTPPFDPWMDYSSSEPGYDANEGDLPANAQIQWNVLSITHWDGTGTPNFGPVASIEGGYSPNPWPQPTDSQGGFHAHPNFGLGDMADGSSLPDGVYLAELSLSVETLEDSDPFYLVALVDQTINSQPDADAIVSAAEDVGQLTRDYLEDPSAGDPIFAGQNYKFYADAVRHVEALAVPEPSSLCLLLMSLGALTQRRK